MNKMIVAVFDSETAAFEGLSDLRELHRDGAFTLYSSAVITKDDAGNVALKQAADKGPYGTATGMAVGSLIGLMMGPLGVSAGAAAGAVATAAAGGAVVGGSVGGLTGMLIDLDEAGVDAGFVDEVSEALSNGKTAVIAEVEEYWTTPIDTRMADHGGMVFRRLRYEVAEDQYRREAEAFDAEIKQLKAEWKESNEEAKAKIEAKIEASKAKVQALQDQTKAKMDSLKTEADAKIASLKQQHAEAKEENKAKIEAKVEEVKADYHERNEKLSEAWDLTKEALAP